jgi:hypothetical protein
MRLRSARVERRSKRSKHRSRSPSWCHYTAALRDSRYSRDFRYRLRARPSPMRVQISRRPSVTGTIRHRSVRHLIADGRRCYRIAAAVTTVVAVAALTLGASGQLFAPDARPSTTKAVLAQDTSTQDPSSQAAAGGAADDVPRRCPRGRRTSPPPRSVGRCRSTPGSPSARCPARATRPRGACPTTPSAPGGRAHPG